MSKLICPICKTATAFIPERIHQKAPLDDRDEDDVHFVKVIASMESDDYAVIRCKACDRTFIAERIGYDEWIGVHPIYHKNASKDVPSPINNYFEEANLCFAVGAYIGCLMLCRTTMIALQRQKNVLNLKQLATGGVISDKLFRQADEVRLWANVMSHEDIEPGIVNKDATEQLLTYVESLLDAVYVQPARLDALTSKRKKIKQDSEGN